MAGVPVFLAVVAGILVVSMVLRTRSVLQNPGPGQSESYSDNCRFKGSKCHNCDIVGMLKLDRIL